MTLKLCPHQTNVLHIHGPRSISTVGANVTEEGLEGELLPDGEGACEEVILLHVGRQGRDPMSMLFYDNVETSPLFIRGTVAAG